MNNSQTSSNAKVSMPPNHKRGKSYNLPQLEKRGKVKSNNLTTPIKGSQLPNMGIQSNLLSPRVSRFNKSILINKSLDDIDLKQIKSLGLPDVWTEVMPYYTIERKLGSGTYGTVVGAKCKQSNQVVAIKHIKDFSLYDYDCCKLIREVQIMSGLEEVSKNKKSCFFPQLLDIIVPSDAN